MAQVQIFCCRARGVAFPDESNHLGWAGVTPRQGVHANAPIMPFYSTHCIGRSTVLELSDTTLPTERQYTHSLSSALQEPRAACLTGDWQLSLKYGMFWLNELRLSCASARRSALSGVLMNASMNALITTVPLHGTTGLPVRRNIWSANQIRSPSPP